MGTPVITFFTGNNVNDVYTSAIITIKDFVNRDLLIPSCPRGERRLQFPAPVMSQYYNPQERVLFDPIRDCNPYFHFMESLWILGGRNDVAWLKQWLPSIDKYSDDGRIFHGAYGYRLRSNQQMSRVITRLIEEQDTTRAVLQIYNEEFDAGYTGVDMPCNTTIFLGIQESKLNLTVCNRSNDMIWGAYGANVVQFSMLQEYIANKVGCGIGWYVQMSNNAHVYPDNPATQRVLQSQLQLDINPYAYLELPAVKPYPLGAQELTWDIDLTTFLYGTGKLVTPFFNDVVQPFSDSHKLYRLKKYDEAIKTAEKIAATDWQMACIQWLSRRAFKAEKAA